MSPDKTDQPNDRPIAVGTFINSVDSVSHVRWDILNWAKCVFAKKYRGQRAGTGSTNPLVSVVIPAYNHARFVREAIMSVAAQTYPAIELIIIDDGSTDDTTEVIEATLRELGRKMRVVFRTQENAGICTTLNRGLAFCEGDYVQFLASDDAYLPEKTERSVDALISAGPDVAAVYCDGYIVDEKSVRRDLFSNRYPIPIGSNVHRELLITNWIPSLGILYRRDKVMMLGGFDQNLGFEDWDFLLRLTKDYKVAYIVDRLFLYRVHSRNISRDSAFIQDTTRAIIKKHADLDAYTQLKSEMKENPIMAILRHWREFDMILRRVNRSIFTNRGIQRDSLPKALQQLSELALHHATVYFRAAIYKFKGLKFGQGCKVGGRFKVRGNRQNLKIGSDVIFKGDVEFILPRGRGQGCVAIGDGCVIASGAVFHCMAGYLTLGSFSYVGRNVLLQSNGNLKIGDWTLIAANAGVYASNHVTLDRDRPFGQQANRFVGITIGENCWIGHGAVVADGADIGSGCIVGPNQVVRGIHNDHSRLI